MRIGRTIPPAASPISTKDIANGVLALIRPQKEIARFRDELKACFGVKHCFLVSSGKSALTLILLGLRDLHPERNTVLIPAFCCYSVPSAVIRAGLQIRLCDVDPDTLDFDFAPLEKNASEPPPDFAAQAAHAVGPKDSRLLAVVPVHLFGLVADVERVRRAVADPDITIIEDAAQVMGAEAGGRKLGTIGDVGFFSLGRGKALSAVEGGVIVTNRDDIAGSIARRLGPIPCGGPTDMLRQLVLAVGLSVCQHPVFFWIPKSIPFLRLGETIFDPDFQMRKLSAFQAGLARGWRQRLAGFSTVRRRAAEQWERLPLPRDLGRFRTRDGRQPTYIRYPIRVRDQARWTTLLKASQAEGLGVMLTYPQPIHRISQLEKNFIGQDFPAATRLSKEILTLPVHPLLSARDRQRIEAFIISGSGGRPPKVMRETGI